MPDSWTATADGTPTLQGLIAYAIHPGGVKTETALNMPENMHSYLTQTAELSADTIVWLTRERKEW
jgi:hypothetical protein